MKNGILLFFLIFLLGCAEGGFLAPTDTANKLSNEIEDSGHKIIQIKPTIYFKPLLQDHDDKCLDAVRVILRDPKGLSLISLCPEDREACLMQGSCRIKKGDSVRRFNFSSVHDSEARFIEITEHECTEGYGIQNRCLKPFVSLAADLRYYPPGTVFFSAQLKGLRLPNGILHSGYLIVEDTGGQVVGPHRLDFYTGQWSWRDAQNPFARLGLGDPKKQQSLQLISLP